MPDTTITGLTSGTPASDWVLPADNASGSATFRITVGSIVAMVTNASQLTAGTLPFARIPVGSTSTTVCVGNDARLSDSRTPTAHKASHATGGSDALTAADIGAAASSHAHGNISNAGAIGSTSGLPVVTGASGVLQVGAWGTLSGQFCQGNDSRLSDARTPTSHASSHQPNGSDAILPRSLTTTLSGSNNNYDVSGYDIVRITSAGNVTITGLTASPQAPVLIINENASGGGTITLTHESSSSTAANRVRSQTGADIVLQPDGGQVWLAYSPVASRWRA